jgi:hypothetical protein
LHSGEPGVDAVGTELGELERRRLPRRVADRPGLRVARRRGPGERDGAEVRERQRTAPPEDEQDEGASAIHSAEVRSGSGTVARRVTRTRRVVFVSWSVTCVPWTSTAAVTRSPGASFNAIGIDGAGTISYQAA